MEALLVTAVSYLKLAVEAVGAAIVGFGALATVVVYLLSVFGIRKRSYTEIRLLLGRYLVVLNSISLMDSLVCAIRFPAKSLSSSVLYDRYGASKNFRMGPLRDSSS